MTGMDLLKVLDVDGSGTIDTVVLSRSLKQFDEAVFTEEIVNDLIDAMGEANEGRIDIQAFVELIDRPLLAEVDSEMDSFVDDDKNLKGRTPKAAPELAAATAHASALESYMDGFVSEIQGFKDVVDLDSLDQITSDSFVGGVEGLARMKKELTQKARSYMLEAQRKHISPLWDEFDTDGNRVLDPSECQTLVASYLRTLVAKSSDMVLETIKLSFWLSTVIFERRVTDEEARDKMRAHAERQIRVLHAKLAPVVKEMMEKMASEDPAALSDELLQALDLNHDGKVTREEFEQHFLEAMQKLLGPEALMEKVHRKNSASARGVA